MHLPITACLIFVLLTSGQAFAQQAQLPPLKRLPRPAETASSEAVVPQQIQPSNQVLEIPLPETFNGCWYGEVDRTDSRRKLNHSLFPLFISWQPKAYELCFQRRGLNLWQLSYGASTLVGYGAETLVRAQSIKFLRMDGPSIVELQADMTFVTLGITKDETSVLRCDLSNGAPLQVQGNITADWNGAPWMEAQWHTGFQPKPSLQ